MCKLHLEIIEKKELLQIIKSIFDTLGIIIDEYSRK